MSKPVSVLAGAIALLAGLCAAPIAQAATILGGSSLLTPTHATQLESWVIDDPTLAYDGSLVLTNIFTKGVTETTAAQFHSAGDGKGPTIFVAYATATQLDGTKRSGLVGGFNPQSWSSTSDYNFTSDLDDRTAFIFNLTTGERRDQVASAEGLYQTRNLAGYGPTFGGGHDIYVDNTLSWGYLFSYSYCPAAMLATGCQNLGDLLGGAMPNGLDVTFGGLEVFTLSTIPLAAVPVPAALPMLGAGLGVLMLIGRRKRLRLAA